MTSRRRAQYLAGVAAVCRVYGPKLDLIRPPDVAEPANVIDAVDRVLPLVTAQLRDVRALEPPEELRPKVERWLALQERRLGMLEKAQAAGRRAGLSARSSIAYVDFAARGLGRPGASHGDRDPAPALLSLRARFRSSCYPALTPRLPRLYTSSDPLS